MTPIKSCAASCLVLGALLAGSASAHGVRFGFNFAFPVFPVWYYPAPVYYYYPPAVMATPPVYVERNERPVDAPAAPDDYWYYCPDSRTYYPYVRQCAGAWQRVSPRPPDLR